jgi:hypothetical protein
MQNIHIGGLDALMRTFGNILEEVCRRPYDLLDASKTVFERDFLEFNVHISDLESSIQVNIFPNVLLCCHIHVFKIFFFSRRLII